MKRTRDPLFHTREIHITMLGHIVAYSIKRGRLTTLCRALRLLPRLLLVQMWSYLMGGSDPAW